jgi:hypothetical protein
LIPSPCLAHCKQAPPSRLHWRDAFTSTMFNESKQ